MEIYNEYIATSDDGTFSLQENKRSGILNYSVNQVASLLGESESKIRYYTNIFDDLLKIPVSNKELIYSEKDIDKLEFLLRLKDKGLSIKEIQAYCNDITLDEIDIHKKTNSTSISDFVNLIMEKHDVKYNELKTEIFNYIDNSKKELINELSKQFQNEMSAIKDDFKIMLNENLEMLKDELSKNDSRINDRINNLSSHFDEKSEKLAEDIIFKMNKYENVMQRAYSIEQDMNLEMKKTRGFFARLLGAK